MAKITYENKVALNENASIPDINKVNASDMNEIKSVVNGNDNNVGHISTLKTTNKTYMFAVITKMLSLQIVLIYQI